MKLELDLSATILNDLDSFLKRVNATLADFGIHEDIKKLSELENFLKRIRILKPKESYIGVTLDVDGYIKTVQPLHDFVIKQDVPRDILQGYYKILNGVIFLDSTRQALLWGNE